MWEFRRRSRGGTYYFVDRGGEIVPIGAVAKELQREDSARGPTVCLSADLAEYDQLIEIPTGLESLNSTP